MISLVLATWLVGASPLAGSVEAVTCALNAVRDATHQPYLKRHSPSSTLVWTSLTKHYSRGNDNTNGFNGGGGGGYGGGGYGGGGGGFGGGGGDRMNNLGAGLQTQQWGKSLHLSTTTGCTVLLT